MRKYNLVLNKNGESLGIGNIVETVFGLTVKIISVTPPSTPTCTGRICVEVFDETHLRINNKPAVIFAEFIEVTS